MVRVALLGHGVVGSGVAEILHDRARELEISAGTAIRLDRILDQREFPSLPYASLFTKDPEDILGNPDIDIVVECLGGVSPAGDWALRAVQAGQSLVTSNKAMVVARGDEIESVARAHDAGFYAEASVAGGIPILRPLKICLAGNRLDRIGGILNGTTNYILTRMQGGAAPFATALDEAQQLGYAERDPSADIEGDDARRKLAILAHVAFGALLEDDERIACRGITEITREDMQYARALGRVIRLVALGERTDGGWNGWVMPVMLPAGHPLAGVSDVFNAVIAHGDRVGDTMFYGRGAGKDPTASALVGDIVEAARTRGAPWHWRDHETTHFSQESRPSRWFVRFTVQDVSKGAAQLKILAPEARQLVDTIPREIGMVTGEMSGAQLDAFLRKTITLGLAPSAPIRYDNP